MAKFYPAFIVLLVHCSFAQEALKDQVVNQEERQYGNNRYSQQSNMMNGYMRPASNSQNGNYNQQQQQYGNRNQQPMRGSYQSHYGNGNNQRYSSNYYAMQTNNNGYQSYGYSNVSSTNRPLTVGPATLTTSTSTTTTATTSSIATAATTAPTAVLHCVSTSPTGIQTGVCGLPADLDARGCTQIIPSTNCPTGSICCGNFGTGPSVINPTPTPATTSAAPPTATPTVTPTATPITTPPVNPTATPTVIPITTPTATPTVTPIVTPTATPVTTPTVNPATIPTTTPTTTPTTNPTTTATTAPTTTPTTTPAATPTPTPIPTPTPQPRAQCGVANNNNNFFLVREGITASRNFQPMPFERNEFGFMNETIDERAIFNRVVGGEDVPNGAATECWQIAVNIRFPALGSFRCGGTILSPRTIITAAHCLFYNNAVSPPTPAFILANTPMSVVIGPTNYDPRVGFNTVPNCGQTINVVQAVPHPNYAGGPTYDNDIAVLTLATPIDFAAKSACACKICLRQDRAAPATGTRCLTTGFGNEIDQKPKPPPPAPRPQIPLKITTANIRPNDPANCLNRPGKDLTLWVCAGQGIDTGICQGDSGGPLFCFDPAARAQYLVGITSHAVGCGTSNTPDMFTAVHRYIDNFVLPNSADRDQISFI